MEKSGKRDRSRLRSERDGEMEKEKTDNVLKQRLACQAKKREKNSGIRARKKKMLKREEGREGR